MPTVIDSFVLELGLDPSKFTSGQREAMDALRKFQEGALGAGTAIEAQSKKTFDLLSSFRREALTILGVFFGGREAGEFINYITTLDAATGRLGRTLGMSARDVSAWQGAFEQIGGTAESANGALSGLSGEMNRFQLTGQSTILPVLSRLGVSLYDQNRNLKTAGQLWLDLADAVQGMDPRQAQAFLSMIPGANQDMINFALLGRRAMQDYIDSAQKARDLTDQDVKAAQEYQRQLSLLERAATSFGQVLVTVLGPAVSAAMSGMTRLISAMHTGEVYGAGDRALGVSGQSQYNFGRALVAAVVGPKAAEEIYGPASSGNAPAPEGNSNWDNFLAGLSYLETSQTNAPATPGHSAAGYFQFQPATASRAASAGIQDPRVGSYSDQAAATTAYIKKFHPEAAAAIERGDFGPAIAALRGEWPSLPGGSQGQSASRYQTFSQELGGGGPRPGNSTSVTIGSISVNAPNAKDAEGVAREIAPALKRSLSAGAANYGQQ